LYAYGKYPDEQFVDNLRDTMKAQIIARDETGFAQSLESMRRQNRHFTQSGNETNPRPSLK
jgi:hypothetical protein